MQLAIRAKAMRESISLMQGWTPGDKASGDRMIGQLTTLTVDRHKQSAGAALHYFEKYRTAEGVTGSAQLVLPVITPDLITPSLYVTTFRFVGNSLARGMSLQAAKQNALASGAGSVARLALSGGRQAITQTAIKDKAGWARITSGDGCSFCNMLASRGAVYGEDSVDFAAHDHCGCTAEPSY